MGVIINIMREVVCSHLKVMLSVGLWRDLV